MSENGVPMSFLSAAHSHSARRPDDGARHTLTARLAARLFAARFDRMLAVGAPAPAGSGLALHAARLTSLDEREAIARVLRRSLHGARNSDARLSSRVPLNVPNIVAAGDRIDQVTLRLHAPRPVTARGMARLRVLLSDGTGPMYRYGRGDLEGRLGAALAAL